MVDYAKIGPARSVMRCDEIENEFVVCAKLATARACIADYKSACDQKQEAIDCAKHVIAEQQQRSAELEHELRAVTRQRDETWDTLIRERKEWQKLDCQIALLQRDLAFANDAAAKGETARQSAAGMEARIAELERAVRIAYDDGAQGGSPLQASTLALLGSLFERRST